MAERRRTTEHQNRDRDNHSTMRHEEVDGRIGGPRRPKVRREQRHARSRQSGKIRKLDHNWHRLNTSPNCAPHCKVVKLKRQIRPMDALMRVAERPPDQFVRGETEAERRPHYPGDSSAGTSVAPAQHHQQNRRAGNPNQQ